MFLKRERIKYMKYYSKALDWMQSVFKWAMIVSMFTFILVKPENWS